ncbi:MAG: DUF354 domain-containing protein [Bacteroidetes bacterium]|nr:DUF354 domain-containing protein [Bacteroidota bacterium]
MKKRIIFDVGHPAQVHHFKHLYWKLKKLGWSGLFTVKDKEIAIELVQKYDLPYKIVGKNKKGLVRKIFNLVSDIWKFLILVKNFKPDIIVSRFSLHSAFVGKLTSTINIGFADTEHTGFIDGITEPFVNLKFTGFSYRNNFKKNHYRYKGNIELFYLHPNLFTPNRMLLNDLNIDSTKKIVIIRFVSWNAHHDVGNKGISFEEKIKLVQKLSKDANVIITSEQELPSEFEPYRISIGVEHIHDLISFSDLYIGEGGSMASEAAVLGIPSIYINPLTMGYLEEEEKFGLLFRCKDVKEGFIKAKEILDNRNIKIEFQERRDQYLSEMIDVTEYMAWFINNYPQSLNEISQNPEYQNKFK